MATCEAKAWGSIVWKERKVRIGPTLVKHVWNYIMYVMHNF